MADEPFDPTQYGATAVASPTPDTFDPTQFGAVPVQQPTPQSGEVAPPDISGIQAATDYGQQQGAPDIQELAKTEQKFSQEHPYLYGVAKGVAGIIPTSMDQLKQAATLPRVGNFETEQLPQSEELGAAWRGERGPVAQAESITGTVLQALPLTGVLFGKSPFKASASDLALVDSIRGAQPKTPTLTETLGLSEKQPGVVQAANDALTELESKYAPPEAQPVPAATEATTNVLGKQEPVAPTTATGTGEGLSVDQKAGQVWDGMTPDERFRHLAGMNPFEVALDRKRFVSTSNKPWSDLQGGNKDILANTLLYKETPPASEAPVSTTGSGIQETGGATTAPLSTETTTEGGTNAIQEPSTGEILQRQPEETGATGGERVGVEPSVQRQETPQARQGIKTESTQEPLIFGYTFDQIKSAQQGGRLVDAIRGSPVKPKATEADYALLEKHGLEGLQNKELFGVLDRLGLPMEKPSPVSVPTETTTAQPLPQTKSARQGTEAGTQAHAVGDLWYSGVGPEGETTWVTSNLEKAKIYAQRRGAGGRIHVYTPEQVGETAFADQEGNLMSPQEYARTQSQDTTIQAPPQSEGKPLPKPIQILDANGNPIKAQPTQPEVATEPTSLTSTKNAVVDQERAARGLPEVTAPLRKEFGESWDKATKKIDSDPTYPDRLIEEIRSKPRALTDEENATLLHRQVDLQNQFQKASENLFKARESGDATATTEHQAQSSALLDQLLDLYDVGKKAGTETGRGLAARKMLAAEDFSLANMLTQKRVANQGAPLTDTQIAQVQSHATKVNAAQTALDAYEQSPRLAAYKKRLTTLTEQYKQRTEKGDFSPRQRNKIPLDREAEQLKANLDRAKKDFYKELSRDQARNRTPSQKFWDRFVGVERAMKLSSDVVLAKLTAAAGVRELVLTPAEEAAGSVISKVLPGLAKRAPREGGFSLGAELKAKSEMFTTGMRDAWQNLKMKQTDLDTLYKTGRLPPPEEFYDYMGYLHGALKAPIKRAEFARSLTKRMEWAVKNGMDLNKQSTMRELSEQAYVDANRSIFLQDNIVSNMFTSALRIAEKSKIAPNLGPAASRIGKFLVPIVKVPTNIVGEVATGVHGLATGGTRAGYAYLKGIRNLEPAQADAILRQLKKGAIGNALILTGYFGADAIGGFYHNQDKRAAGDVKPGRYRVGGVDLPASAGHSTGAMLLNIGATVKRVENEQIKKTEPTLKGKGAGIRAAASGVTHELPFIPAFTGITDAMGSDQGLSKYINGMITSTTTPALFSHFAKIIDTPGTLPSNLLDEPVKRKPTNPVEAFKMGIPGLRQTVPEGGKKSVNVSLRR